MAILQINGERFPVEPGARLSDVLPPRHTLAMPCAGMGRCGKCRVRAEGALSPFSPEELAHLTPQERAEGIRLACCARAAGDCSVTLLDEGVSQIYAQGAMPDFPRDPLFTEYGAAVDIGTTTLAVRLYGADGLLAEAAAPNPQAGFGADVISRIERALAGEGGALAHSIRTGISALLHELAEKAAIETAQIDTLVLTGNTAMLTLLTDTSPEPLSHAPFAAERLFGEALAAEELELPCPGARVYLPRCMSAFVGADITMAVLASGLCGDGETRLLTDIGTNGEMALWCGGKLLCCSTAAGPAFEGAGLSMGMAGKAGAIDHIAVRNGRLNVHVLGGGEPRGICGSGVVDALACLLETGGLDETGRLGEDPAVLLAPVSLSQKDVRMVQLAKSAVCAGIQALLHTAAVQVDDVERLDVAGGFGSYLDVSSAAKIGLIPAELAPRVRVFGNAALAGASMLLLNRGFWEQSAAMADSAQTLDLSTDPVFLERYTDGMLFED